MRFSGVKVKIVRLKSSQSEVLPFLKMAEFLGGDGKSPLAIVTPFHPHHL